MRKLRISSAIICLSIMLMLLFSNCIKADNDRINNQRLRTMVNDYLSKIKSDGTYDELYSYWFDNNDSNKSIDYSKLIGENGHIIFGTTTQEPFSYVNKGERVGFTIDIVYHFCLEYGYSVEFQDYSNSSGLITALQNGKCDFGGGNTSITEERKELIDFSEPFFENFTVFVVNKDRLDDFKTVEDFNGYTVATVTGCSIPDRIKTISNEIKVSEYNSIADACKALDNDMIDAVCYDKEVLALAMDNYPNQAIAMNLDGGDCFAFLFAKTDSNKNLSLIDNIKNSIQRNFVEGERYKLILDGLVTTLKITVLSIIFGTLLGFIVFMSTKKGNIIVKVFSFVVDGLPGVVLLMIMYYVIFGKANFGSIVVSVIVFTLIFASSTHSLLRTAVGAIDKGQFEVSYALGYKKNEAFFKMILPQTLMLVWPGYKGAIISQIKATAIVGYIAEQDLTKAGDMIRSSTFEAFFPLIVVALIYFLLAWVLTTIVNVVSYFVGPSESKSRRFLKGVKR